MRKNVVAPVAAGILLLTTGAADAGSKQTSMTVSATVAANCVVGAGDLSFGTYDGSAAKTGSSNVTVRCSNGTPYSVKLSTGGGSYDTRLLTDGTHSLEYNLFTSSAYTTVWGDGTSSTAFQSGTGTGLSSSQAITHVVHGQLPNSGTNQDAPPGDYSDAVTVTVEY
jgi:spore coat protein U-like protein